MMETAPPIKNTKPSGNEDKPEAPAKGGLNGGLLKSDDEGPGGEEAVVDEVAEEQGDASEGHQVGAVARNNYEEEVGENPESKCHPEEDRGVVSCLAVVPPPAEALGVHGKVFADSEDWEGKALLQGCNVVLLHLGGAHPVESLVVVYVA